MAEVSDGLYHRRHQMLVITMLDQIDNNVIDARRLID